MEPVHSGLSVSGILANLPHDPATIFVLVLLVAAIGGVVWVSRPQP